MTGDPPVLDRSALWAALSNMQIEAPGAARFEEALAEEQGWPLDFAGRVAGEYRRFLYLAATAGFEVTPSKVVDEAWHLHLRYPHYREMLCRQILPRPLEHRPAAGEPGEAERHRQQYEKTVALYERAFLKPPPSDIWPGPISPADLEAERKRRRNPELARQVAAGAALAALAAYGLGYAWTAILLAGTALIIALAADRLIPRTNRPPGSAGCGGGCSGGASRSDDGPGWGDASCGGGGCGGD